MQVHLSLVENEYSSESSITPEAKQKGRKSRECTIITLLRLQKIPLSGIILFVHRLKTYLRTFEMTPAPTVCPPSRIANRRPSSKATGTISCTVILALSPGMTISTPCGNVAVVYFFSASRFHLPN
jgi:hypothetical protein